MKKIYMLLVIALFAFTNIIAQTNYFSKASATDFNDVNTWGIAADGTGTSPASISNADNFTVSNAAVLSLSASASVRTLVISSGSFTIAANTLTVKIGTGNTANFSVTGGSFNMTGGSLVIDGYMINTGGAFNQSGGAITIDPNNAGATATSTTSAQHTLDLSSTIAPVWSGGTITIVDPPATTAITHQSFRYSAASANSEVGIGHTIIFGDGVSTTSGGAAGGFYVGNWISSGRLNFGNFIVNGTGGVNRMVTLSSFTQAIRGNLTINPSSEFTLAVGLIVSGNIINNGTFTTATSTLTLAGVTGTGAVVNTAAQTVSGTGVFRNLATAPTANFAAITINNSNAAGISFANGFSNIATQPANSVSISGALTFTLGTLNSANNLFVLGTSVPAAGTLSYPVAASISGFKSGTTFGRWYTAAGTGSAITAAADPTTATSRFPFISAAGTARSMWVSRVTPTAGGIIGITYNEASGTSAVSPIVADGAYNINTRSNDSWTTSLLSGTAAAATYTLSIVAPGSYVAPDATTRIMKAATVVGNHQNGTITPGGQRIGVTAANLLGTYYLGFNLPSCFIPITLVNTGITNNSANHSWAAPLTGTTPAGYEWAVTTSATPPATGTATTALTASSTGLTAGTIYYLHVRTFCGGTDYSTWATSTFSTQSLLPSPYVEPFTTTTTPAGYNTTGWIIGTARGVLGNPGNNIYKNLYNTVPTGTYSTVNVGPIIAGDHLTFDYKTANYGTPFGAPGAGTGEFVLAISTDFGTTYTTIATIPTGATATWQPYDLDLSSYAGQNVKVRIIGNWISGDYDLAFDNIKIQAPPTCFAPTALVNSAVTSTTASHAWTAATPSPAAGYEWAVTTSITPPASGTFTTGLTASSTGLIANTTYYLHVRSDCGAGLFSSWATSSSFYTGYCLFSSSTVGSHVDNFATTGGTTNISNLASGFSTNGYGDFTTQKVTQFAGGTVNFSITGVPAAANNNGYAIYVDFNNDLLFGTTERVYSSNSYILTPLSNTFLIPTAQAVGNYRMRVVTDYNLTNPVACGVISRGEAEDYTLEVVAAPPCVGPISGGTATTSTTTVCGSGTTILNSTGISTGTGITLQWQSSPSGAGTFTDIPGAITLPYTTAAISASTDFQLVVTCSNGPVNGTSNIVTVNVGSVPANNDCEGSIFVSTIPNAPSCTGTTLVNTTCATTSPNTSNSWISSQDDDVWYTFAATSTSQTLLISNATFTVGSPTAVGVSVYNDSSNCANVNIAHELPVANVPATITLTSGSGTGTLGGLIVGNRYTLRLLTSGTTSRISFSFCLMDPPAVVPDCATALLPANGATNVATIPNVTLTWTAPTTGGPVASYDVYISATTPIPAATVALNSATTSLPLIGFAANTTYYWYVVPKNAAGNAVGCNIEQSFITSAICNPFTTNGGTGGDGLTDYVLNGEAATAISVIGALPIASPGYIDLSATTTVDLAAGKAYVGNFKTQDANDYLTIWIDYNNNGGFEADEIVLNHLKAIAVSTTTPYSLWIKPTATVGTHKMRVRNIYNSALPTVAISPCATYTYGEGKDFTINIIAGTGAPYVISSAGAAACSPNAFTTIDVEANNNNVQVPLLDASGALIAQLNANGNNLGKVTHSIYRNTSGTVRTDAITQKYMDRNITITPEAQPVSPVNVRLYYTAAELAALQAVVPTATTSTLTVSKTAQDCAAAFAGVATFLPNTGSGAQGTDWYLDVQTPSFSSFYIKNELGALPVSIEYLNGTKQSNGNVIDWKISCTAIPEVTIELQRSADSRNFRGIYTENATSVRCLQAFVYNDATPAAGINYYRLKLTEPNGAVKYSSIIALINKDKGYEIVSLAPNPARVNATLTVASAKAGKIDIVITDLVGKIISKQQNNIVGGNNTIAMNFAQLAAGTYNIVITNADGEVKSTRFVKY